MMRWGTWQGVIRGSSLGLASLLALACSGSSEGSSPEQPEVDTAETPDPVDETPVNEPLTEPAVAEAWTLDALPEDAVPVGITQSPVTRAVYVLATHAGLYKMGLDGPELVFDTTDLEGQGVPLQSDFTDVVALSEARFALTAKNEGYLLDLIDGSLTLFFCYLPAEPTEPENVSPTSISVTLEAEGVDVYQTTQAVAYDPVAGLLYAQPLTVDSETGEVYASEVGAFWGDSGEPANWLTLEDSSFQATGMVSTDGQTFTFVAGTEVYLMGRNGVHLPIFDLATYGVEDIAGLAPRHAAEGARQAFWLLDGGARKVLKLDLP